MFVYFVKEEDPTNIRKATIYKTAEETGDGYFTLRDMFGSMYPRKVNEFSHDIDAIKPFALGLCAERAVRLSQEVSRLSAPTLNIEE